MRIVYLNPVGEIGGAERSLLQLLTEIGKADPSLERRLIVGTEGRLRSEAEKLGVQTELLPLPAGLSSFGDSQLHDRKRGIRILAMLLRAVSALPGMIAYLFRLRRRLRELAPTIIHSNGIKTHIVAAIVRPKEAKLVWHIRDFLGDRPLVGRIMRLVSARATIAVANSHAVRNDAALVLRSLNVVTIYNAIDTERFAPGVGDGAELDRLAGLSQLPRESIRVGLVATYARWKGQAAFIEAASIVAREAPTLPIYFYIIGSPIYRTTGSQYTEAELRECVTKFGLVDRVGFVPFQDDAVPVYRALDIVVQASTRREPFGLTIVEAMACGRAMVVALAGGAAEIVEPGVNALGFSPGDIPELAQGIIKLAVNPSMRSRLAEQGRATVVQRFSAIRLGKQFSDLYAEITA
ncbi:MAG: glycosyltransferase family 4 protein [Planctomycetia bacterium]|nr:glycosyltransferase family 4 protein [Planctomycetia bacterium]